MYRNCQVVNNIVELISWDFIDVILHAISKTNCDFILPIWLLLIQDDIPGIFDFWDTLGGQGCGSRPCRIKPISHNFDDSPKFMGINPHSTIKLLMAMKTLCFPQLNGWWWISPLLSIPCIWVSTWVKKPPKAYFIGNLSWTRPFFPLTCDFLVIYSRSKKYCDIDGIIAIFATLIYLC